MLLVFLAGGLPPMVKQPDVVYERLFSTVNLHRDELYETYSEQRG